MYLLTDDMPEVAEVNKATSEEVIHVVDFDGELYLRQERGGMLMGTYERACRPWSEQETSWDFGHELLESDLDRIAPSLEVGFKHFPAFERAGIRKIINGPFSFAPDGNPLIGPVKGMTNFWCACGVMAGFSQGGGVGLSLANWMIEGDAGFDVWGDGCESLWRLRHHGIYQCKSARELFASLFDSLPERGANCCSPSFDDSDL